jgi:ATP-dependent DNA helicase DinG
MNHSVNNKQLQRWFSELGLREFVALDLETTGLDAESHRIIEVGAVRFQDGVEVDVFEQLVNPNEPLPPFITELTGLTDDDLQNQPSFSTVANDLLEFIGTVPIAGQNVVFDLGFLTSEGRRIDHAKRRRNPFTFSKHEVLDTAQLCRIFWPEWPRFGLAMLAEKFGIEQISKHRAVADACVTGHVLSKIIESLPNRVWGELARDLAYLSRGTFHRSERFFMRLEELAASCGPPDDVKRQFEQVNDADENTAEELPSLEEVFDEQGLLQKVLPNYELRPAQLQMAQAVRTSLEQNEILLCEAPTGVGKSLSYLVSSALWTADNSDEARQVIVSSHTKALQEQLHRKEMQTLHDLRIPVRSAILKGRKNYLCCRRLRSVIREAPAQLSDEDRLRLMPLIRWAATTKTGDISEAGGFRPESASWLWAQVCSDAISCSRSSCGTTKGCFYRTAQERAAKAQIIFVNHALLFSDPSRFTIKPAPLRKFVLDEGHHIERAAASAASIELDSFKLRSVLMRLLEERADRGLLTRLSARGEASDTEIEKLTMELRDHTAGLYMAIRSCFDGLASALPSKEAIGISKIRYRHDDRIHHTLSEYGDSLLLQWRELVAEFQKLLRLLSELTGEDALPREFLLELRSSLERLSETEQALQRIFEATDEEWVYWTQTHAGNRGRSVSLHGRLVLIGPLLEQKFWPLVDTAVVTSATLATDGTFEHCKASLGLGDVPVDRLSETMLSSPFDLKEQMRLFVPVYFPNPRGQSDAWSSHIAQLLAEIMRRHRRGTLVLTTSLKLLDSLAAELTPIAKSEQRTLLAQGRDGAPAKLLEEFRKRKNAILLGAANFWEGVDVVGEALEILIVTRLPFDVPSDPWIASRLDKFSDAGSDAFKQLSLPEAVLRLRQGLGRLIRHRHDKGIAIITDSRIFTTRFGALIRSELPIEAIAVTSPSDLWRMCAEFLPETSQSCSESSSELSYNETTNR